MQLGIFARTFPGTTPLAVLSAARDAGYEAVQYNMACSGLGALPHSVPDEAIEEVRTASEATGVRLAALSATYNMLHPDRTALEAGRSSFSALAGAARRMGSAVVTVCTGSRDAQDQWRFNPDNASPAAWESFLSEMRLLLPLAEKHGVMIGVEPEMANVVSSARHARRMLDLLDHRCLGIVLDPANLFEDKSDFRNGAVIDDAIDLLSDRLVLVHAKDRRADGSVAPFGAGMVDATRFIARLRRVGFDGPLVTHGLSAEEAPGVARLLRRCLDTTGC